MKGTSLLNSLVKPGKMGPTFATPRVRSKQSPPSRPKYGLIITGFLTLGMGTALVTYAAVLAKSDTAIVQRHGIPADVSDRYDKTAKTFDTEVGASEVVMGLGWIRSWLVRKAIGNVLEVSVGTARNAPYYKTRQCQTITMLDQSPEMIEQARRKFRDAQPDYRKRKYITQSALDPIDHPTEGYDTIVQTMGLCSTPQPIQLLQNLGSITKPVTGRILLLEHGQGYYDWLNRILDNAAPGHADQHGCWWNKDIGKIVEESGLEVVEMKRYHFGTTWWFILKPKST